MLMIELKKYSLCRIVLRYPGHNELRYSSGCITHGEVKKSELPRLELEV
jgi:hypothetical protein